MFKVRLVAAAALLVLSGCGGSATEQTAAAGPTASPSAEADLDVVDLSGLVFELAALGVPVAGGIYNAEFSGPTLEGIEGLDPQVKATTLAAPTVTEGLELDLEALARVDPDLIVIDESYVQYYAGTLDRARQVAEVKVIPSGTWQATTIALAEAVGVPDAGRRRVAEAEQAVTTLTGAVGAAGKAGSSVSLLRFFQEPLAFVPPSLPSQIVTAAGLVQPAAQGPGTPNDGGLPDAQAQKKLSQEVLGAHDADVLVFGYSSAAASELATFRALPVVAQLPVVKAGRVGTVPYFLWALNSAVGVDRIVSDLQSIVVEGTYAG
ncbi:MAG TPA: ABC transporter substrate-binding protein [Mycobacteriales bacterium]|nr:ABC transporter substrate-binding protein [Mycobacteriales bacterium]